MFVLHFQRDKTQRRCVNLMRSAEWKRSLSPFGSVATPKGKSADLWSAPT